MNLTKINTSIFMITLLFLIFGFESNQTAVTEANETNSHDEFTLKTVTGPLSGFDCAVVGELCPTTHRGADYTTGVFTEEDTFFFVVNIPQSFLQQYFRETIEVEGTIYDFYDHAIEPESIYLIDGDERRLVYDSGYFIDENDQRATFQDGVYRNGRWNVQ